MKNNDANLPDGWIKATISVLADYVNGRAFKPTEWKDTGKPIIRIQNLNNGSAKYNFSPENHEEKYLVKNGDLLFAWSASLGAYIWHGGDAWLNQHIFLVHPKDCTTKLFIFYLLEKITTELYAKAHGSGMVHVTKGKFESTEISLPPLLEQHRIVAKIEELFSDLDKGIENLKTAQAQLKVYRQALLKHAFEGKLTAQWRAQRRAKQTVAPAQAGAQPLNDMDSPPTPSRGQAMRGNDEAGSGNGKPLESAEALLKRIQQERAQRYQQQLAEWEKSPSVPLLQRGKPTSTAPIPPLEKGWRGGISKPKPPKTLPPLTAEELAELPELPEGWGWCKLGDFIDSIEAGKSFKCDEREPSVNEIGVAKVSAVTWGEYDESESKTCNDTSKENEAYLIRSGDFILSRANTIDLVGACVIARKVTKKIMLSDKTLRIKFDGFSQEYFLQYLGSRIGRNQIMRLSTGNQESMRNIGQDRIRSIVVPICSEIEAEAVNEALASRLSETDQLDQTITTALQQAEALRQSILKKAFSGQLVPQDPNDEPASELLARIKVDRVVHKTIIKP